MCNTVRVTQGRYLSIKPGNRSHWLEEAEPRRACGQDLALVWPLALSHSACMALSRGVSTRNGPAHALQRGTQSQLAESCTARSQHRTEMLDTGFDFSSAGARRDVCVGRTGFNGTLGTREFESTEIRLLTISSPPVHVPENPFSQATARNSLSRATGGNEALSHGAGSAAHPSADTRTPAEECHRR